MSKNVNNYAQALVEGALGKWLEQLSEVQRRLHRSTALASTLSDANSSPIARMNAVREITPANAASEITQFVRLLVQNGDIHLLGETIRKVRTMVPSIGNKSDVLITSAQELSSAEKQSLEDKLRSKHGSDIQVQYDVNPDLLGGMRIRIGDEVMDYTVAARLEALRERLIG